MIIKKIKLYSFDELNDKAKERAINDHIQFEISEIGLRADDEQHNPYWQYAMEMERMQTPWFLPELIYQKEKQGIIDTIKANEYLFYSDGELIEREMYPEPVPSLRTRIANYFQELLQSISRARRKFNLIDLVLFAPAVAALVKSLLNA